MCGLCWSYYLQFPMVFIENKALLLLGTDCSNASHQIQRALEVDLLASSTKIHHTSQSTAGLRSV